MISRVHSHLVYSHHQWKLRDNRSVNGVFVNDRKVHEAVLCDGDMVVFGGGGNRPIGAIFEQPDSEFKYQFRTNPHWNIGISTNDEESEDDTVESGTTEGLRLPTSETPLFDLSANKTSSSSSPNSMLMSSMEQQEEQTASNSKKRKRDIYQETHPQAAVNGDIMNEAVEGDGIGGDNRDMTQLADSSEWPAGSLPKRFCAAPIDDTQASSSSSSNTHVHRLGFVHSVSAIHGANRVTRQKTRSETSSPDPASDGDALDVESRLMEVVSDEEACARIASRQEALFEACRARREIEPIFPFSDDSPLQCKYCKNLMLNPTTIGCGHAMCDGCVEALAIEKPECPVCAEPIHFPIQPDHVLQGKIIDIVREWNTLQRQEWIYRMMKRNEAVKLAGLELLLESCKARGIRFLNIEERWSDEERATFMEGIDIYTGASRIVFCRAVGLTATWLEHADFDRLLLAISNIGITITPFVNRARGVYAQLSASTGAPSPSPISTGFLIPSSLESLQSEPAAAAVSAATKTTTKTFEEVVLTCLREGIIQHIANNRRISVYYNQYQHQIQQQQLQQQQLLQQQQPQQFLRQLNAGAVVVFAHFNPLHHHHHHQQHQQPPIQRQHHHHHNHQNQQQGRHGRHQ